MINKKAPVEVGEVIAGKYEVERVLAAGGMGIVVVARHRQLEKQVAIKFMLPELLSAGVEPDALERFVREGRAAVRLRGENIARVHDVDTLPDGMPYMVMEYLEGMDLSQHVRKHGPLPLGESVDYVLQACVAMAEAHLCGIVHRDLKPSNLFLTRRPDGTPLLKVLDFGISKLYTDPGAERTATAVVMGSPSFMAPEQAVSARNADVRSDIWSLGVILYECTSKQLPYENHASTAAVLAQLIYETPRPLGQVAPNLPAAFCKVVDTCLQKEPAHRYQSIGDLATALLPFASAVGRQAVASIHAIIGGSPAPAIPVPAERDRERSAPFRPGHASAPAPGPTPGNDTEADLPEADTDLALAAPSGMQAAAASVPAAGAMAAAAAVALPASPVAGGALPPRRNLMGEGGEMDADAVASAQPLELAIDVHDPQVRRDLSLYPREPAPTRKGLSWRAWLDVHRLADVSALVALATLTAMTLLSGGGPAWLDGLNAAIRELGYLSAGWASGYARPLAGPAMQIAIPITLALVLARLGGSLATSVAVWWLGHNLVHVGRFIQEIDQNTSLAGQGHPWSQGLWARGLGYIAQPSGILHWAGVVLMVAVLLYVLRRIVRQLLLRLR
jgi:serine/threonine-protein kinase